jgi:hypothetical protein
VSLRSTAGWRPSCLRHDFSAESAPGLKTGIFLSNINPNVSPIRVLANIAYPLASPRWVCQWAKKCGSVATPVDTAAETHPCDVAASDHYIGAPATRGCVPYFNFDIFLHAPFKGLNLRTALRDTAAPHLCATWANRAGIWAKKSGSIATPVDATAETQP